MRYGGKMPLEDSGSAGWQGVSGIGLLEGDCFATLIHDRLFPVHFSPADWESRVESWMPNEAWKATTESVEGSQYGMLSKASTKLRTECSSTKRI